MLRLIVPAGGPRIGTPLLIAGLLALAACTGDESASADGDGRAASEEASVAGSTETVSVFDLAVGDCFNAEAEETVEDVTAVGCAEPHDYEVLALVQHPAGPEEGFPGVDEVLAFAEDECLAQWEPYVGLPYERSELSAFALHPTEETWRVGDREIACLAYIEGEQLEGSVRDSNR